MELTERETLVRVEQQLKDSVTNQSQIMTNLKEIFQRIEKESKVVSTLQGNFNTYKGTSSIQLKTIIDRLNYQNTKANDIQQQTKSLEDEFDAEKLNFTKKLSDEKLKRTNFQKSVMSSIHTVAWIFGSLATLATILSAFQLFLK